MDMLQQTWLQGEDWGGKVYSNGWQTVDGRLDVIEPATGARLGTIGTASVSDVATAAKAARDAQAPWAEVPYDERSSIMLRVVAKAQEHFEEIVDWLVREAGADNLVQRRGYHSLHRSQAALDRAALVAEALAAEHGVRSHRTTSADLVLQIT